MRKFFQIVITVVTISIAFTSANAAVSNSLNQRVKLSLKLNNYIYKPGQAIDLKLVVKPINKKIPDVRSTIQFLDINNEIIFNRTYYEGMLDKRLEHQISRQTDELEPGRYKVRAKITSKQKLIRQQELEFGVVPEKSKLNLVLIFNIAEKPLLDLDGNLTDTAIDSIERIYQNLEIIRSKNFYFSVSPLLLEELKIISSGAKQKSDNKTIVIPKDHDIAKKAKASYSHLSKLMKSSNSFEQTFSVADNSSRSVEEITWQTKTSGNKPFITNSSPSEIILNTTNSKVLFFNTDRFVFRSYEGKRIVGIDPVGSKTISSFSNRRVNSLIAFIAQKLAQGKNKMVLIANGIPTTEFQRDLIKNIKKTKSIKISKLPPSPEAYRAINLKSKKLTKNNLYSKIVDLKTAIGPESKYTKKAIKDYLKYRHALSDKKTKQQFFKYLNNSIQEQFNNFSLKPQKVTLTSSSGKVPVGIFSKASYNANLKIVIKSKDFKIPKSLPLKIKPKENVAVIPVTALFGGRNSIKVYLYGGNYLISKDTLIVNVVLPSTVMRYIYISLAFLVLLIAGAFVFREVRHRKIGKAK